MENYQPTVTNATQRLRQCYERYLLAFEQADEVARQMRLGALQYESRVCKEEIFSPFLLSLSFLILYLLLRW